MMHKFAFEAVDRIFHNIIQIDESFERKTFVFGGNFCQILSVIPCASYIHIISASLHQSTIWKYMKVIKLTINMKLLHIQDS